MGDVSDCNVMGHDFSKEKNESCHDRGKLQIGSSLEHSYIFRHLSASRIALRLSMTESHEQLRHQTHLALNATLTHDIE